MYQKLHMELGTHQTRYPQWSTMSFRAITWHHQIERAHPPLGKTMLAESCEPSPIPRESSIGNSHQRTIQILNNNQNTNKYKQNLDNKNSYTTAAVVELSSATTVYSLARYINRTTPNTEHSQMNKNSLKIPRGSQKPLFEGQTIQWSPDKIWKTTHLSTEHYTGNKVWVVRTALKIDDSELMSSKRLRNYCSTSDTHSINIKLRGYNLILKSFWTTVCLINVREWTVQRNWQHI